MQNENVFKIINPEANYGEINKANMETYLSAAAQIEMLKTMIIGPFENKLKEDTGFDKDNLPEKKETLERRIGNHKFKIDVTPTHNPKYGEAYNLMDEYLQGLVHGALEGRKREGVRNNEAGVYVLLHDVIDNLNQSIEDTTEPGVKIEIKTSKGKDSEKLTKTVLQLDYDRDYSTTEGNGAGHNARDYIESKKIVGKIAKVITTPFEKAIKSQTGYSKENVPEEVKYTKDPVGNVLCYVVNSPADSVSYGKIVDEFIKYVDELTDESANNLKSGIDELRHFEGKAFVKLASLTDKLEEIKKDYTTTGIRQSVSYLRRPKDDKIIVE